MAPRLPDVASLGDVAGKRVLVRSDLNVPLEHDDDGGAARITDDGRIRASVPQLRQLLDAGASVIVCAHLGRPKGSPDPRYSLAPVAERLGELLDEKVAFVEDPAGGDVSTRGSDASLTVLENVRFSPGETSKDDAVRGELAARFAALADVYVGDGFGAMHRKHASVYDTPRLLPHAAGQLVLAEVAVLRQLTTSPARPYVVVLGGAKV
ncbi:MAG: phosphoglycerate kinase, partial [Frankiales bacterium]|nr:phosphoglycerate kinase [Frankiales bacterium]